jgi:ketosteroid isomerase-like protein
LSTATGYLSASCSLNRARAGLVPFWSHALRRERKGRFGMMKMFASVVAACMLGAGTIGTAPLTASSPQVDVSDPAAQVNTVVTKRFNATGAKSVAEIADLYLQSDDLVVFRSGRITRGWTAYEAYWERALSRLPKGFQVSFSNVRVTASGDAGWASAEWTTTYQAEDGHRAVGNGLMTLILTKTAAGWRIVHEHISEKK